MLRPLLLSALIALSALPAFGWGRRGHSIVAETAAYLVAEEPNADFMKDHSFDLGYFANVPDLIWKGPATYEIETSNHFMDMEIFERELKGVNVSKPFVLDRATFNSSFPNIPNSAGRAFWRIREIAASLDETTKILSKTDLSPEARRKAQGEWLVYAGTLAHYVGDLAQPLHTTENYDGQFSDQKGVHSFFEDTMVNELFPAIETEASLLARKKWKEFRKKNSSTPLLQLLTELASDSNKHIAELLKIDKKVGRKDLKKAASAYHPLIAARLAKGALVLAEIWRRETGWRFDSNRFYWFDGAPAYNYPPGATPAPGSGAASAPGSGAASAPGSGAASGPGSGPVSKPAVKK